MNDHKKQLAVSILIPLAVGAVSGFLTRNAMKAFDLVKQPPLSPPDWIFPVVWTILYILMGIAAYLIYKEGPKKPAVRQALRLYAVQLVFNFLWTFFFFQFQWFLFSLIWLIALWIQVLILIFQFRKINTRAGNLMIPYLVWLTFAAYLNLGVYLLN